MTASSEPASKLSTAIARSFLRGGNYPWLRAVGAVHRKRSRRSGGHRFLVPRPGNITLDGWFCPAPTHHREAPRLGNSPRRDDAPKLPVLICHGIFEFKERYFDRAAWLNARGHDVMLFDTRTHGRSTGKRLTFGVEEREDVRAVLDAAEQRGLLDTTITPKPSVITLGFSLGGGTVLQHAATDPRVAGVIALAPFADFKTAIETFRACFTPWMDRDWLNAGFDAAAAEAGFAVNQASALDAIERIDAPVLLVEAGKDAYLPPALHTEALRQRRGDRPTVVLRVPAARHISLVRKRWPVLDATLGKFLDDCASR